MFLKVYVKPKCLTAPLKGLKSRTMSYTPKERALNTYRVLNEISPPTISFLDESEPYQLLISVILSAQTTDRQVNEIAKELFGRFPTPLALSQAETEEVVPYIRSTGFFNTKAKNIVGTAQKLVENFAGEVPLTMEELLTLPGVGRKTANVIIGQLAGEPAIIVDTHFGRVVRRIGLTTKKESDLIERAVAKLLPREYHYRYSMVANLHGREICHARKPLCSMCPIAQWCKSYPIQ